VCRRVGLLGFVLGIGLWAGAGSVLAAGSPGWVVGMVPAPASFSPVLNTECVDHVGQFLENTRVCDEYAVTVANRGAAATNGSRISLSDSLPAGLSVAAHTLIEVEGKEPGARVESTELPGSDCGVTGTVVSCSLAGRVPPDGLLQLYVFVTVDEPATPGSLTSTVTVEGGGAPRVESSFVNALEGPAPVFGFYGFSAGLLGAGGLAETVAGGHPYELPVSIDLNTVLGDTPEGESRATSVHDPRDFVVDLPPGVSGSALSAPMCTLHELSTVNKGSTGSLSTCPTDSIVGYLRTQPEGLVSATSPIYNVVPERGVAAEFGFLDTVDAPHAIDVGIASTPEGYVVRSTAREVPQVLIDEIITSIYGDPAARDKSHEAGVPMFTNPSVCTGKPLVTHIYMDSWQSPGLDNPDGSPAVEDPAGGWASGESSSPAVTGCEALDESFHPSIAAQTETGRADTPTGLNVGITVPQQQPEALSTPPVREIEVKLPEGLTVNPSSANGLAACSESQIGWQGKTPAEPSELEDFNAAAAEASPQEEELAREGVPGEPAHCPKASRIGTVEVQSPALPAEACKGEARALDECAKEEPAGSGVFPEREKTPLLGSVYLAAQTENPFKDLIAAYFVIDDPRTGVVVKLPGRVQLNEATGQLTTIVKDSPQFPFSQLQTHIFGGETASLSTPMRCGSYTLASALTAWSHEPGPGETTGTPVAEPSSTIEVSAGVGGTGCPGAILGFAPGVTAGTSSSQAAGATSVEASIDRGDDEQEVLAVDVTTRPGLTALIKNVPQCPEPQAAEGNCGPESLIGEATSAVGAGSKPYWVHGGEVYLTGPYNKGPFGLSIVIPTTAGPFTLTGIHGGFGKEVVRSSLRVNPNSAQASAVSEGIPQRIQGITLQIRTIDVSIDHPNFGLNPTNCEPLPTTTELTGAEGTSTSTSTPFHLSGCTSLPFAPKLTATAAAQGSKLNGTAFSVDVSSPGLGQANIHKVDLTIPAVLPSRLETIQKACPDHVFETNPAGCDEGSMIGEGIVHTPILANPLRGPAYLVSHAAAAFPDIEFVLQGEGVTIILDGKTDIKNKITYSDFETAPDAPFTTFETTFPAGPHSALTAHIPEREFYNLCKQPRITMPTTIVAQNNAEIHQNTTIELTGCPKHISITSHKHNHQTLTITIYVPGPGKLRATGHGLHTTTTKTTSRELITLKIHLNHHHPTHTTIHLQYTPTTGTKQTTTQHTQL
jgi:uncharacterized repeat protein (TIGR01451 family)